MLTRPVLTFGRLDATGGLNGEDGVLRLNVTVAQWRSGAGRSLGRTVRFWGCCRASRRWKNRQLPPEVNFAVSAQAIRGFLSEKRRRQRHVARRCQRAARAVDAGRGRSDGACVLLELNGALNARHEPQKSRIIPMRLFSCAGAWVRRHSPARIAAAHPAHGTRRASDAGG